MRINVAPAAAVFALLGLAGTAAAQTATGQISGTVRDATGAVVPGATVTVNSDLTGLTRTATTDSNADYVFALLPPGTYSVKAELTGFSTALESGIRLLVDNKIRVDLTLKIGNVAEIIEVRAATVAIQSENATVSQTLTEKQITELPLNGRNFLSLLFLNAGAVETAGEQGTFRQGVGNAISLQGARPTSNNFMIDGTANIDMGVGTPAAVLSVDAMEEFTQQNKTYSAEYGFSANQINLVSKSGSNQFHGTGFYFARDDAWDAKNFFDRPDREKPPLDQKQFGGTVSGPIVKDKTFVLLNYEGTRIERGASRFATVPTADMLAGRFTTPIRDPLTGQPFPNNTIPASRFSRLAQLAIRNQWFPAPNTNLPQGNYQDSPVNSTTQNQFNVRLDQDLGRYGRAFARLTRNTFENDRPSGYITPGIGDIHTNQTTNNYQVSHTWPIKSNLVNVARVGKVEADAPYYGSVPCSQADVDFVRLAGVFQSIPDQQRGCPGIAIQGFSNVGGAVNDSTLSNQPMWDVSNTTTLVTGSHTLTFGANYRRWKLQRDLATDLLGNFNFGPIFTGNALADFLLGYHSGAAVFQPTPAVTGVVGNPREFNFSYFAPYIQDDWRVSSKLTLNLGLRWDYRPVPYETNNHMAWRNLDNPRGGLLVADESLVSSGVVDGDYYQLAGRRSPENPDRFKVFAPRVSFAYRPFASQETVVRGGYGMFFDSAEGREIDGAADVFPYVSRGAYNQNITTVNPRTTDQLFTPLGVGVAIPAYNSFLAVSQSPEPRNPKVQQWSLGVQHALTRATTVELNYVGSHGSNLLMRRMISQATPFTPDNPTVAGRRPFPNFGTYIDADWSGWSDYHALNAIATHRSRDLIVTAAYTWGKSTDSKSAAAGIGGSAFNGWQGFLNNHDPARDHGLSDFDVAHRLAVSFVWQLPFGRDRKFGGSASGLTQALVGGWQINGIYILQGGFPLSVQAADAGCLNDLPFCAAVNRANIVGDINSGGGTIERWFNTDAFAQPGPGVLGNSGRNILRGPGINNLDLSLFKNFNAGPTTLQLRIEAFNALNHPQFNAVSTNITAPTFGVVTGARDARIVQLGMKVLW